MEFYKDDKPGLYQKAPSVMNGEVNRRPYHGSPAGLMIRARRIDCMLADVHAQIQMLRWEMTYLRLVRRELAGMEAKRRESSPCSTSSR